MHRISFCLKIGGATLGVQPPQGRRPFKAKKNNPEDPLPLPLWEDKNPGENKRKNPDGDDFLIPLKKIEIVRLLFREWHHSQTNFLKKGKADKNWMFDQNNHHLGPSKIKLPKNKPSKRNHDLGWFISR